MKKYKNKTGAAGISRALIKTAVVLLAFALFAFNNGEAMTRLRSVPNAFYAETETALEEKLAEAGISKLAVSSGDETLGQSTVKLMLPMGLSFGRIPAFIGHRPVLCVGGESVGISILTRGVLIVGISGFENRNGVTVAPASKAGLKAGDVILEANGVSISASNELENALELAEGESFLTVERGGRRRQVSVAPERDAEGRLRIGAWVRDSTVGVGTLSFYDGNTGLFAALGHPVLDADTGSLLKVRDGKLKSAAILGVTKGAQGAPGELHGSFGEESADIGAIELNTELGVFGRLCQGAKEMLSERAFETAFPDEVHTGEAVILSAASGRVEEYSILIIKAGRQVGPAPKGLVIEVTDERLIALTGGIVQGMSGSPIIQDGRLVGAVTHVFVNDPLKGYGAYAYWMFKAAGGECA